jgi:hypothetical protein
MATAIADHFLWMLRARHPSSDTRIDVRRLIRCGA